MHSDKKFDWGWGGISYTDSRKKGSGMLFKFASSEKELPEWRSGAFCHKKKTLPIAMIHSYVHHNLQNSHKQNQEGCTTKTF
jgi:hypothetical protein